MPIVFPQWNAGVVSEIGSGITLTAGTISASGGGGTQEWQAGTVTALGNGVTIASETLDINWQAALVTGVGDGLDIDADALVAEWQMGTVTALDGLSLASGTLTATGGTQEWQAGTVTALDASITLTGGTLAAVAGGSQEWNAGTVTAIGTGITLAAGTISASGGGGGSPGGSDGQVQYNDNGSFAGFWGHQAGPTPPPASDFATWYNQNSATITDNTNGPLVIASTQTSGSNANSHVCKNVHATDWTITVNAALGGQGVTNATRAYPIVLTDGTKFYTLTQMMTTGIQVQSWSTIQVSNAVASTLVAVPINPAWYRASYDSATTTLTFSYSVDGVTWSILYTTASPYFTPTQYGFGLAVRSNVSGMVVNVSVYQFIET